MENNEIWVFLSHSNKDFEKVRRVRDMLENQHMRPLMFFLNCLTDDEEIDNLIKPLIPQNHYKLYFLST